MNMKRIYNEAVYRNNQMMMIMKYKNPKKKKQEITLSKWCIASA